MSKKESSFYWLLYHPFSHLPLCHFLQWLLTSLAMVGLGAHRDGVVEEYLSSPDIFHDLLALTVDYRVHSPFVTSLEDDSFEWSSFFPKSVFYKPFFEFSSGKNPWHNNSASPKNWPSILIDWLTWYYRIKATKEDLWESVGIRDALLLIQSMLIFYKTFVSVVAYLWNPYYNASLFWFGSTTWCCTMSSHIQAFIRIIGGLMAHLILVIL